MEKNSLLTFFEVLSSKIKYWILPKNTISTLDFLMFENIISVDSQSELGKKKHRALGFLAFNKPSLSRVISCGQITNQNTTVIAPVTTQTKWGNYLFSSNKIHLFVILILFSTNSFAQVVLPPSDIDCPSKDLEVTGAILPAPANDPCSCSGTRTLQLGIINKTGSDRTSFAMWGKLIRKDASGNPIGLPVSIFACASGIDKLSTKFYTTTATIDVHCNESIDIIDVILAWTSSNNKETCEVLRNNPSTINPKCGRVNSIRVETGVDASFTVINATCTSNGSIQVFPFGGIAPYKVKIGNVERTGIVAGGSTTFSLPSGDYNILLTDNRPCSSTRSRTIGSSSVPTVSAGTAFKKTCADNTNGGPIGETAVNGFSYSWSSSPAGFSSSSANPTVNPTVTTVYTVRKTNSATDCYADASVTVTVDNSAPTVSAGTAFKTTCTANTSGGSIGETAVNGFSYSWSSSPAGFSSSSANPTVNPTVTTVYTVRKTNGTTNCYADASVTVTVDNSTPTVSAGTAFKKTCTANTSGGSIGETADTGFSYSWSSSPAGFSSSSANPTVNPTVTTVYTVRKTNSATDCYADASVTVTVDNSTPTVSAGTAFKKTCTANTSGGSIGETAVSGFSYSWSSSPAGFSSSSANPAVNPTVTTVYTLRKTNSTTDCYADASVTVTVDNSTPTVSAGTAFKKTCTANTSGGSIGETAVSGFSYSWTSSPAGFSSSSANPTVNPTVTTVYTVRKTNSTTDCYADASVTVTVDTNSPDTPTFCVIQPSLCSTAKGSVKINSPCGADYEYSIKNGGTGTWQSAILFDNLNPGDVTGIRVRNKNTGCVSNAASCDVSNCSVSPCSSTAGKIANTDTKTNVTAAPIEAKTTTVGFDAYPVPFKDQLTIKYKFDYKSDVKIEVFNAQGMSLLSKIDTTSYLDKEVTLDLKASKRQGQVYVVKVTTNQGTFTKKVMSSK